MKHNVLKKITALALVGCLTITSFTYNANAKKVDFSLSPGKIIPQNEIKYKKPSPVKSLNKPTKVKVYRSTEAAMVEFQKVEGADYYKIYRKTGKGKYFYLGRVNESDFYASTYFNHVRQFVDIRYKSSKKKSSAFYKKKAYKYNLNYKYKVIAVNRSVKSKGTVVGSKKWKKKKNELSYYTLYLANKQRKKLKRDYYTWGHHFEKGSLIRAKEMVTQSKKPGNKWHCRPNGMNWANAYTYMRKYTAVDPETLAEGDPGIFAENVGVSYSGCTKNVIRSYLKSPGHSALFTLKDEDEAGDKDILLWWNGFNVTVPANSVIRTYSGLTAATYCKDLTKSNNVYHQMIINDEPYIVD